MKVFKGTQDNTNVITAIPSPFTLEFKEGSWTQQVLTENGTMGGKYFATSTSSTYNSEYPYLAFDGKDTTQFTLNGNTGNITIYFPRPLKITNVNIMNGKDSGYVRPISSGVVSGSDNNSSWTQITTFTNSVTSVKGTWNINMSSNTKFYKYYKFDLVGDGSYARITKMTITATSMNNLTLKSGSKVYVPNGFNGSTPIFNEITLTADKSQTINDKNVRPFFYRSAQDTFQAFGTHTSGTGPSTTSGNEVVYRTDLNKIELYTNGALVTQGLSLPVCTAIGTQYINETFNGIGYIGNYFFALPHVKGNIPNGFNSNGTNKVTKFDYSTVLMRVTDSDWYGKSSQLRFWENEIAYGTVPYDRSTNYNRISMPDGGVRACVNSGNVTIDANGKVTAISQPSVKSATMDSYRVHVNGNVYSVMNL